MPAQATDWKPIETAPAHKELLVWDGRPLVAMLIHGKWHVTKNAGFATPTLWQEIEPPAADTDR